MEEMDILQFKEALNTLYTDIVSDNLTSAVLGEIFDCDYVFVSIHNEKTNSTIEQVLPTSPELPKIDFTPEITALLDDVSSDEDSYFLDHQTAQRVGLGPKASVIAKPINGTFLWGTLAIAKVDGGTWDNGDLEKMDAIVELILRWRELSLSLHENQNYADTIFNSVRDSIFITSKEGIMLHFNQATEKIFGYPAGWALGKHYTETVPSREKERTVKTIDYVKRTRKPVELRFIKYMRLDKQPIYINPSYYPWIDEDGELLGIIGIVSDETENKYFEDKLVKAEKMAALGQTVAQVAHEVRSPLAAIRGFARMIEKDETSARSKEYAGPIVEQVDVINSMVQELLDFGKPVEDEFELQELDINEVLKKAIRMSMVDKNKVTVIENYCDPLPLVEGDRQKLERVFVNLLNNAYQSLDETKIIEVATSLSADNYLNITVRDSGRGIPEEIIDKIYDPCFTTKDIGTGLGLFVVQQFIAKHNGRIEVTSDVDRGTCFEIKLPFNK
jgi:PAS domain S-box-containing protein